MMDVEAEVRTYLLSQSAVTDQVSTRIWASPGVPREEVTSMPRKAIALYADGGPGAEAYVPESVATVQIRCYGATMAEAWTVYQAVFGALHRAHHQEPSSGNVILTFHELSHPVSSVEPLTDWPFVLVRYRVRYATDSVT